MTTARNLLYAQLIKVLAEKSSETVRERVQRTLEDYRVQTRPGTQLPEGLTARESMLGDVLNACSRVDPKEIARCLNKVFESYRMQTKRASKKGTRARDGSRLGKQGSKRAADLRKKGVKTEALGGGPQKRSKARGECPKCHSKGVVLAHSYAGDDYFSCIYCGFQAYRAIVETDLDLPLAAELLGRRFDEKKEVEPDEAKNEKIN